MKVMVNGLPGNMAGLLASHIVLTEGFELVPYSLTGPEITQSYVVVAGTDIKLIPPSDKNLIEYVVFNNAGIIVADFTHPDAVVSNAQLYRTYHVPFVMGTTGGDREALMKVVLESDISAVIAPNMAKQIVALMAMFKWAAETFPGAFAGFDVELVESHQKSKADTSGTMREMVKHLARLGLNCSEDDIVKVRDPDAQVTMGVPKSALNGHAYHTYTLVSPEGTTVIQVQHNVIGRDIYARGALDALKFLEQKILGGAKGHVYSMIDVLSAQL